MLGRKILRGIEVLPASKAIFEFSGRKPVQEQQWLFRVYMDQTDRAINSETFVNHAILKNICSKMGSTMMLDLYTPPQFLKVRYNNKREGMHLDSDSSYYKESFWTMLPKLCFRESFYPEQPTLERNSEKIQSQRSPTWLRVNTIVSL